MELKNNPEKIFDRLVKLANTRASSHDPFICCDMVHDQDQLFDIQGQLATLLGALADSLGTPFVERLAKEMPHTFSAVPA